MDRMTVYPGAIPYETDLLSAERFLYEGIGQLAFDLLGSSTLISGFACAPTAPASLSALVAPGRIYSFQNLDASSWGNVGAEGGLPADTNSDHNILKQGLLRNTQTCTFAAPGTVGQSINYLVQVAFSEADITPVVLPFFNADAPDNPWSGPDDTGAVLNTVRTDLAVVSVKAGTAATTGTQTTPTPDVGNVGMWVVTVAYSQTTITSGNIVRYASAPFIPNTVPNLAPLNSPAFTGTPTAPTPTAGDSSTLIPTTAFVQTAILNGIGTRLAAEFAPAPTAPATMTVTIAAGHVFKDTSLTEVALQTTTTFTAPGSNSRIDRIVIDRATGVYSIVAGTPGASPVAPAIPTGKNPVARVLLTSTTTSITAANITDERDIFSLGLGLAAFKALGGNIVDDGSGNLTISAGSVTNAMHSAMAANTAKVNATAGSASPTDIALAVNQLLGRGSSGNIAAIALASSLTMGAGTTLTPVAATTAVAGILALLASAGFVTGTDSTSALTASLFNVGTRNVRLPGGFIIQWGTQANVTNSTDGSGTNSTVTLPVSFVSGMDGACINLAGTAGGTTTQTAYIAVNASSFKIAGAQAGSNNYFWIAFGK